MISLSRFLCGVGTLFLACACLVGTARAQQAQNSDNGGSQVSDVSGSIFIDQGRMSESNRARVQSVAVGLVESIRSGQIQNGAQQPIRVPRAVAEVLTDRDSRGKDRTAVVAALVEGGLSEQRADVLTRAMAELLAKDPVELDQFVRAVDALNLAVEAAPASFLAHPPDEFVALHAILLELLRATTS
jgi:hypothetical protein